MTKINRMIMRGFKSFGEKTDLVFDPQFNCILGPNGSGKCLRGDSLVTLANGTSIPIQELVEKQLQKYPEYVQKIDDGVIGHKGNATILGLNLVTNKIESMPVSAFIKRTAPKTLLRITTRSGRSVVATEYHPLFILDNGKLRSIRSDELREGISVAVPR